MAPALAPKAFISYAWTSDEFRQWVIRFASDLRARGIDVVLDAWELQPGHDLFHFMEQSVADPTVTHVLIICNAPYASKADGRTGGVGSEAQIITPELYGKTKNTKFIPVIAERDSSNAPCLPTFLKSIVHVDLSSEQVYHEGLEHLLRLLYGAPEFPKPPLGPKPSYLAETATPASSTLGLANGARYALREQKPTAKSQARDYLRALCDTLGNLCVRRDDARELDDAVMDAITVGKTFRDEYLDFLEVLCSTAAAPDTVRLVANFLEGTLACTERLQSATHFDGELDAIRFVRMEIFLYTLSTLEKCERGDVVRQLLKETYVVDNGSGYLVERNYRAFFDVVTTISETRRQRLRSNRVSLVADLLKARADRGLVRFERLQESELALYLRCFIEGEDSYPWPPRTLVYARHESPLPMFVGLQSPRRLEQLQAYIDVRDARDFRSKYVAKVPPESRSLKLGDWPLSVDALVNLEKLPV